jgi:hypothetical protein
LPLPFLPTSRGATHSRGGVRFGYMDKPDVGGSSPPGVINWCLCDHTPYERGATPGWVVTQLVF